MGVARDKDSSFVSRNQVASVMAGWIAQDWDSFIKRSRNKMVLESYEGDDGGGLHFEAKEGLLL